MNASGTIESSGKRHDYGNVLQTQEEAMGEEVSRFYSFIALSIVSMIPPLFSLPCSYIPTR